MKRIVLAVIWGLMACSQVFAQSQPIMGYDKVEWGTSVDAVRKAFNLGNSIVLQENFQKNADLAALVQKNVSEKIKERTFLFLKLKGNYQLCRVFVVYFDASNSSAQALLTGLTNKFGEKTDSRSSSSTFTDTERTIFGKYAPELVVELVHTYPNQRGIAHIQIGAPIDVGEYPLSIGYDCKKMFDAYKSRDAEF